MSSGRKKRHLKKPPLSAREVRFCVLWVDKGNATQCYLDAGFPAKATRQDTASAAGYLLKKPQISEFIRNLQTAATESAKITIDDLARGFKRATDADVTRLTGADGQMLPPHEWPEEIRLAIVRMEAEPVTDRRTDPANADRTIRVVIGTKYKVWLENKTECRKILAQWKRMIGQDAETGKGAAPPLVVGGDADPGAL